MTEYSQNQAWLTSGNQLIAELTSENLEMPEFDPLTNAAVRSTVEAFGQCLLSGIDPYQFGLSTEAFFGAFADFVGGGPTSSLSIFGRRSSPTLEPIIPSTVTSVIALDETTALALLAVDQEWTSVGKVPAIILVNVDGQWLINQLAIVEGPPS
jgi:hypothetical protein